jgi:hypothetical protein
LVLLMPYRAWAEVMVGWDVRWEDEAKGGGGKEK